MTGKREDAALIKRMERRHAVLEFRKQGLSYRVIAGKLEEAGIDSVSHQTVKTDCKTALAELAADNMETTEELRQLMLERHDMALEGLHKRVADGDPQAVNAFIAVNKEIAKLTGLYAPERRDTRNWNLSINFAEAVNMLKAADEKLKATSIIDGEVVDGSD
ncbi:hypothetical protein LCGC14_2607560 [marine sediment metagenome]|uniref:Uncharacterized protein n=1 Tax=marine sediment metagenome TaxID=412755 RepID=A0A0F9A748_9ZZZZ